MREKAVILMMLVEFLRRSYIKQIHLEQISKNKVQKKMH